MRDEQQVLICVCRFSVHLNVEASVFFNVYCTVHKVKGKEKEEKQIMGELKTYGYPNWTFVKTSKRSREEDGKNIWFERSVKESFSVKVDNPLRKEVVAYDTTHHPHTMLY